MAGVTVDEGPAARRAGAGERTRTLRRWLATALSVVLVWFALAAPEGAATFNPASFARIPVEGLALTVLVLLLRAGWRAALEAVVGVGLALLILIRVLDLGFRSALQRPFNPVTDWRHVGSAKDLLGDSIGSGPAVVALVAIGLLMLALVLGTPLAVRHISRIITRHPRTSVQAVTALALAWSVCAAFGVRVLPDVPLASSSATALAVHEVTMTKANLEDREVFSALIPVDRFSEASDADLLTALRGKDVVVVFVESYGKVAIERSPAVAESLGSGSTDLATAGFSSRSAWLTSPTFGGISWLAHSTLQSGLWVDTQQRYDQLLGTRRITLTGAFSRAGWRTVHVVPANRQDWPEGRAFYGFDTIYDARTLGYAGPGFGYAPMPDQYTLSAFNRLELARPDREPVMAEIDLVTSHVPFAPLPEPVPWDSIGDGSVFQAQAGRATPQSVVWSSSAGIRAAYGQTIAYSLDTVVSFLRESQADDPVVILLGDHQPLPVVSGADASHDVPISVIARDPAVLDRIAGWGWTDGLRPGAGSPVWPMNLFRDRFLTAYGATPHLAVP